VLVTIELDVGSLAANAVTVDVLARLTLAHRRAGVELTLVGASGGLEELVEFMGLGDVLGLEARRKAEQGEEPVRVEEERELGDAIG
jgi:hypothetical protein